MTMRIILTVFALTVSAHAVELTDDFSSYAEGSYGSPGWYADSVTWEMRGGKLQVSGPTTIAHMQQPRFGTISVEATVILREGTITDWKVAGVCVYSDPGNFWHFALVEAPGHMQQAHFCELTEMRHGVWLAQHNLTQTANEGGQYDWQYDTAYRLRITMTPEGIEGEALDPSGARFAHMAYTFSDKAVTAGRPALRAGGFRGEYDDVKVVASGPVPEPTPEERTFPEYDVAGSDEFPIAEATGFFRAEQREDCWWIVDPNGKTFYAIGTDHCRYAGHWCQDLGYAPYGRKNDEKWESRDAWATRATDRLKSWGFNLLGAGGGHECRYKGLAHTEFVSFGSVFSDYEDICPKVHWTGFPNVFSPKWPAYCEKMASRACRETHNDPWLFGYFLDNELEWYGKSHTESGLFEEAMKKPADHTAKQALLEFLRGKYESVAEFNEAWGADVESFAAILHLEALTGDNAETVRADKIGFVRVIAEEYFKHATAAIRKHDPNHMIIGCRFAGNAPAGIWDICGKYCDIVSFNSYDWIDLEKGVALGVADRFVEYYEQSQRPMMLTEWSYPALDSGLPCKHGAGMRVDTQEQKAECFRIYQEMLFRLPFMVGSDYFMWVDEPELGIADTFPEDSNYGLVNEDDEPYPELTQMATGVNATVYKLHSGRCPEIGVREGYAVFNEGKTAATFTIRAWLDGTKYEEEVTLEAGGQRPVDWAWEMGPGAHLVAIEVDPERRTADGDRGDNLLLDTVWIEGFETPERLAGMPTAPLAVMNQSDKAIENAMAILSMADLPASLGRLSQHILVTDLRGEGLPVQSEPGELVIGVGDLEPWSCLTLLAGRVADGPLPGGEAPMIVTTSLDGRVVLDNHRLRLQVKGDSPGNILDPITLDGVQLGTYNPLVWQEVDGQNQWVRASRIVPARTTGALVRPAGLGPLRACFDVVARGGEEQAITAVDDEGAQEDQVARPVAFEVSSRIVLYPGKPWFLTRLNHIKNIADGPLTMKGYFFYLDGSIGGAAEGDHPAGPDVPNYHGRRGGAWQDDEAGYVFGATPLDESIRVGFWLDEAGGQHPDARRQLDTPVVLEPGETYVDEQQPWLLVYGGKTVDEPWLSIHEVFEELGAVRVEVGDG